MLTWRFYDSNRTDAWKNWRGLHKNKFVPELTFGILKLFARNSMVWPFLAFFIFEDLTFFETSYSQIWPFFKDLATWFAPSIAHCLVHARAHAALEILLYSKTSIFFYGQKFCRKKRPRDKNAFMISLWPPLLYTRQQTRDSDSVLHLANFDRGKNERKSFSLTYFSPSGLLKNNERLTEESMTMLNNNDRT